MSKNSILVTTGQGIDGHKIEKYMGVVSSHVITGTGIFSDVLASFSDFFGGRSGAYKKQLESIKKEAISEVTEKARQIGANAIIGFKIDFDEISGKNLQMLMVTVYGSAVFFNSTIGGSDSQESDLSISNREISREIEKRAFIERLEKAHMNSILDDSYDKLLANSDNEIIEIVIEKLSRYDDVVFTSEFVSRIRGYFYKLEVEELINPIYSAIENALINSKNAFYKVIEGLEIFDYSHIKRLLENENFDIKLCGLRLSVYSKSRYTHQDVNELKSLLRDIDHCFQKNDQVFEVEKMFGANKTVWKCRSGHENELALETCSKCPLDKRGIPSGFYARTVEEILGKIELVSEILNRKNM